MTTADHDTDATPLQRLRARLAQRRHRAERIETHARAQVEADERAVSGPRHERLGLLGAWRQFWHHPSPWIISSTLATAIVARAVVGDLRVRELIIPAVMVVSFPLVEWVVHVFILHLKPASVGPVRIDPLLSRKHREHHADPRDLPVVFIPWQVLVTWLLPLNVVGALLLFPQVGSALTYLVTLGGLGMVYEWTHYLIHSDYPPRSAAYKAVWRNHRLHHYKNENYWFTVTTAGTADRLLGTYPDPATVPTSPTATDLAAR